MQLLVEELLIRVQSLYKLQMGLFININIYINMKYEYKGVIYATHAEALEAKLGDK